MRCFTPPPLPWPGASRPAPVTATFSHRADELVELSVGGGGRLLTTSGHRMYVAGSGWTTVSELSPGDLLRTRDGASDAVAGLRTVTAPQTVWDLTVADLHTFYVLAGASPVLAHNCDGHSPTRSTPRSRSSTAWRSPTVSTTTPAGCMTAPRTPSTT